MHTHIHTRTHARTHARTHTHWVWVVVVSSHERQILMPTLTGNAICPRVWVCVRVCVPVNEAWAWQQRVLLAGLGQGQWQAAGWAWQCSQALSHCTATEPIEQREGEWDKRGGRKGPWLCQLALCGTQSICLPCPALPSVSVCLVIGSLSRLCVFFGVSVCVCGKSTKYK